MDRQCLDEGPDCKGPVAFYARIETQLIPDTTGLAPGFYRCTHHQDKAVERSQELDSRYPVNPPPDFDPMDAGEAWGEDDY